MHIKCHDERHGAASLNDGVPTTMRCPSAMRVPRSARPHHVSGPLAGCLASRKEGPPRSRSPSPHPLDRWRLPDGGVHGRRGPQPVRALPHPGSGDPVHPELDDSATGEGETQELTLLAPPRTTTGLVQIGEAGRTMFPVRDVSESWSTWFDRSGMVASQRGQAVMVGEPSNTSWPTVVFSWRHRGPSAASTVAIERPAALCLRRGPRRTSFHGLRER